MNWPDATTRKLYARRYKVKIHFNRVNMQRGDPNVWTVHFRGRCIQVQRVIIEVPVASVFNPDGKQPRAYFVGDAGSVLERETEALVI